MTILALFAFWVNFSDAQLSYKIILFNSTFTINGYAAPTRRLGEKISTEATTVALSSTDEAGLVLSFSSALNTALNMNNAFSNANVKFMIAAIPASDNTVLDVTIRSKLDFSLAAFAAGRNAETDYITNTIKTGIQQMISDNSLRTAIRANLPSTFGSATVPSAATFSATNAEETGTYSVTVGTFSHDDPRRSSAKVGAVSVGVVIGVILLGLSFYIICFFQPPTTAKVEDGVVSK